MFKEANVIDVNHYCYTVNWSEEDQVYIGRVAEFSSLAAHGNTPAAALREVQDLVKSVVADLAESNEPIPVPFSLAKYSGKFIVRVSESMHRDLVIKAAQERISLNNFINLNLFRSLTLYMSSETIGSAKARRVNEIVKKTIATKKGVKKAHA